MRYWLVKSEPSAWSWEDHWSKSDRIEPWNGVRNHQASNYLRQMAVGDQVFFYQSVTKPGIVGVLEVCRPFYPDPDDEQGKFGMVDMKALRPLARKLDLSELRQHEEIADLPLFRQSRLSVMPVDEASWRFLLKLAEQPASAE